MATDAEREKIQEILSRDEYRMNIHSNYWLRFLNHSNRTVTLSTFAFVVGTRMLGSAYFGAGALLCVGLAKVLKLVLRESRPVGTTYKVTYGMPSTHSATISYYATFITLSCAYLPIHPLFFHTWLDGPINSTIVRWFVWPTAPLVATAVASTVYASRINLGHHTIKQVMGGVCVGVSFGALWFSWWKTGGAQTIAWWAVSLLPDFIQVLIR